jgi:seryl-tRNA synthetase
MHEYVKIGGPSAVASFRAQWLTRGQSIAEALGLGFHVEGASDPFFGRTGTLLAQRQLDADAKYELIVELPNDRRVACMSFNLHQDKFGDIWSIRLRDGSVAHSGCVGFGLERLAMAVLHTHGFSRVNWPAAVVDSLDLARV